MPLRCDVNTRLLESNVNWKKNIDFSLFIVALYAKTLEQYPKHLGISYCMCNVLKASLLCKSVTNFKHINTSTKSKVLMQNTRPLFNNSPTSPYN